MTTVDEKTYNRIYDKGYIDGLTTALGTAVEMLRQGKTPDEMVAGLAGGLKAVQEKVNKGE